ncbi:hypothetical protein [Streptomyces sp. NPDC005773]|uniref:hypothetical protein n=1 Tax=Streptomyces sp. NPDC005773 TaxID=3364727 RepID=UPI0036CB7BB5
MLQDPHPAIGVLGRDVEVLAEPVDQAMRLDRVTTGERQWVCTTYVEYVGK